MFACKILVLFQYSKTTNILCHQRVHTNTAQILPSNLLKKNQISSEPQPFKNESIQEPAKTLIQATEGWPLLNYLCMANCVGLVLAGGGGNWRLAGGARVSQNEVDFTHKIVYISSIYICVYWIIWDNMWNKSESRSSSFRIRA